MDSDHLTALPWEIIVMICGNLQPPGQSALSRTCKHLNTVLTPVVWLEIELHQRGTHEGLSINEDGDCSEVEWDHETTGWSEYPFEDACMQHSSRKYIEPPILKDWDYFAPYNPDGGQRRGRELNWRSLTSADYGHSEEGREELLVQTTLLSPPGRWESLAQHISSLCFSIGVDDELIGWLADLRNLASLEIVGLPLRSKSRSKWYPEGNRPANPPFEVKYPRLKNLKLRGFFPAALVRSICSNARNITHLDLGLLASIRDDDFFKDSLLSRPGGDGPAYATDEDGNYLPDDEDMVPWAFHGPIWLHPEVFPPPAFPKLTHLHIARPFLGSSGRWYDEDSFKLVPDEYERVLVREWAALVRANSETLNELIFDYRLPKDGHGGVWGSDPYPVPVQSEGLPGDFIFCNQVLRMLVQESHLFPQLQRLDFRGIRLQNALLNFEGIDERTRDNETRNNEELLRERFPRCDIQVFQWPVELHVYFGSDVGWAFNRHEPMQDGGDGLMALDRFYNDYVKRFGRCWQVS